MNKPTVVLVHGAFADTSLWTGVASRLQERDYPVVAVANPLRDLESDATYVADVVSSVPGPVVLVAHSYGGVVISRAASETPNVRALVYVASFQPDTGESAFDLVGKYPGSKVGPETLNVLVHQGQPEVTVKPADFAEVVAADLPARTVASLALTQRPVAQQALATPFPSVPAWTKLPSWTLIATQDYAIPTAAQEFMAERAASQVVRVDASHAVTVSQPHAVATIIDAAATRTA